MSSHWYRSKQLFNEDHPEWDTLEPWPLTMSGNRCKRVKWSDKIAAGLKPSVTTWLSDIKGGSVDGLMGFAAKLGRDVGWEMEQDGTWNYDMRDEEYAKSHFWREYKKRRDQYSDTGTKIHNAIEQALKGERLRVMSFVEAKASVQASNFLSEHGLLEGGIAERIIEAKDYAGMVDWSCPSKKCIVDWKTIRDVEGKITRSPYPTELAQVAAYWHALYDSHGVLAGVEYPAVNVYISQRTGEIINIKWWDNLDVAKGMQLFKLAQGVTDMIRHIRI